METYCNVTKHYIYISSPKGVSICSMQHVYRYSLL